MISEPEPFVEETAERELCQLTPSQLISLEVPQKLLRAKRRHIPKDLAAMLLQACAWSQGLEKPCQVVEEEEKFSVHVYRERQDVSLRVLTEPFCMFCHSVLPACHGNVMVRGRETR